MCPPGFEIQLVAGDPDIAKPMNLAFDSRGRLWVSETRLYPYPAKTGQRQERTRSRSSRSAKTACGEDHDLRRRPGHPRRPAIRSPTARASSPTTSTTSAVTPTPTATARPTSARCSTAGSATSATRTAWPATFAAGSTAGSTAATGSTTSPTSRARTATVTAPAIGQHLSHAHRRLAHRAVHHRADQSVRHVAWIRWATSTPPTATASRSTSSCAAGATKHSTATPTTAWASRRAMMEHLHGSTAIAGSCFYADDRFPEEFHGNVFIGNVVTGRINRDKLEYRGSSPKADRAAGFSQQRRSLVSPGEHRARAGRRAVRRGLLQPHHRALRGEARSSRARLSSAGGSGGFRSPPSTPRRPGSLTLVMRQRER